MATQLTTSHDANGGYSLYPSNNTLAAILWDGSLVFLVADGATIALFQSTNPGAGSPTASSVKSFAVAGATSSSLHNGDLFVVGNGSGGSDVWVAFAENGNVGGAYVAHATYDSGGTWTWDTTTSCIANGNGGGAVNQVSIVWNGTYLIVGIRADISGSVEWAINYTTTKNGTGGWLASLVQLSGLLGSTSHYFGSLSYDSGLGCVVAIYSDSTGANADRFKARVLANGSSPALANWGAEVDPGVGTNLNFNDFQGAAVLLDHTTGKLFVAYYDGSGNGKSIGLVVGTITVNGASSTTSWGTPISVGTQSVNDDSPDLAMDSNGQLYILWSNHSTGIAAADVFYATATSPYTSVSAATNLTNSGTVGYNHAMTPRRARLTAGYVPLLYVKGTASPYGIMYDNTSLTFSGSTVNGTVIMGGDQGGMHLVSDAVATALMGGDLGGMHLVSTAVASDTMGGDAGGLILASVALGNDTMGGASGGLVLGTPVYVGASVTAGGVLVGLVLLSYAVASFTAGGDVGGLVLVTSTFPGGAALSDSAEGVAAISAQVRGSAAISDAAVGVATISDSRHA